jgi:hypothetical protein
MLNCDSGSSFVKGDIFKIVSKRKSAGTVGGFVILRCGNTKGFIQLTFSQRPYAISDGLRSL